MAITRHLFLLFTLLLFTGLSINTYAGPVDVPVPDVVGLPQADAEQAIVDAELTVGNVTFENDDTVLIDVVISQNPTAGGPDVPVGSPVDLVVSLGPALVTVPDVVGLDWTIAGNEIINAGLIVGTTTDQSSDTVQAGIVISQDPVEGTVVDAGSAVDLVRSTGPAQVTVPNVTGLSLDDATSALAADGLNV
ncbi:MAG: PASTA domain-containing protein, partial [Gammaproteobacteria bacterium]|nr:PASTA domain-containing protein [Gammaproteobacteria bacterium]